MRTEGIKIILRDLSTMRTGLLENAECKSEYDAVKSLNDAIASLQDELEVRSMINRKEDAFNSKMDSCF